MSFRDNLQHLRATRNMTQEQLAMLLGVSRQSVTKWEAEKSYPEMDKLIKICQLFGCTLDDLVTGDLTQRPSEEPSIPSGPAADVCGYDEHARDFATRISTGTALCVLSVVPTVLLGGPGQRLVWRSEHLELRHAGNPAAVCAHCHRMRFSDSGRPLARSLQARASLH